jgi:hypothetical protein
MERRKPASEAASSTASAQQHTNSGGAPVRASRAPDSLRAAKAESLVSAINEWPDEGEMHLNGATYAGLLFDGLTRAEVHRAIADLEAAGRVTVQASCGSVALRIVEAER